MRSARSFLIVLVLLLGACRQTGTPTETRPGSDTSPLSPVATGPCESVTGGTDGVFVHFTGVETQRKTGFDVITFEFSPSDAGPAAVPKFQIDPIDPPLTQDPSDTPMQVDGDYFARVIFHGASGVEFIGDTYRETYQGPKEIKPDLEVLVEAEEQGDFEATLSWIMGTSRRSCWEAVELSDPLRLEIRFRL